MFFLNPLNVILISRLLKKLLHIFYILILTCIVNEVQLYYSILSSAETLPIYVQTILNKPSDQTPILISYFPRWFYTNILLSTTGYLPELLQEVLKTLLYMSFKTHILYSLVFTLKFIVIIATLVFIRGGIPRYRYDFLTKIGWLKFLNLVLIAFLFTLTLNYVL